MPEFSVSGAVPDIQKRFSMHIAEGPYCAGISSFHHPAARNHLSGKPQICGLHERTLRLRKRMKTGENYIQPAPFAYLSSLFEQRAEHLFSKQSEFPTPEVPHVTECDRIEAQ